MAEMNLEPYKNAAKALIVPKTFAVNGWKGKKTQFKIWKLPPTWINWKNPKVVSLVKKYMARLMPLLTRVDHKSRSPPWKRWKMIQKGKRGYYDRVRPLRKKTKSPPMDPADALASEFADMSFDK